MKISLNTKNINTVRWLSGMLLCLFFTVSFSSTVFAAPASDPQASSKTQAVLDYLTNLPNKPDNRVVSGQHTFMTDNLIENIHTDTGKYVGLVGVDYFYQNNTSTNNQIIAWSNANSLISIVDHMNNPLTGGDAWDTTSVDLTQLITPGTALNNTFKGVLDKIATGLSTLQSNNVVVLFRPFHEMNGNWFWWGNKNTTQFKNLWIYTYNYLTQTKGLHNLLWVWSSNADLAWTFYPGSQYVDIVGVDRYSALTLPKVAGYDQLSTYNKPFGLTEWGACSPAGGCSPTDISPMIDSIKLNMPKTSFFMAWAETFSLDYNTGTSKILADPWVITRDEIALSTNQPLLAPSGLRIVSAQ